MGIINKQELMGLRLVNHYWLLRSVFEHWIRIRNTFHLEGPN